MHYHDLNSITARHLDGTWEVPERLGSTVTDGSPFALCNSITFGPEGSLQVNNGAMESGTWEFFKDTEIIYNPQLNFIFPAGHEVYTAIITRYREDEEATFISLKITLYFTSGLELILQQIHPKSA